MGAHLAARRLLGDVLVDGHVGDIRSESSEIPPLARRSRKPLEWLRRPLRVAAGQTPVAPSPVSDRSLLEEKGLLLFGAAALICTLLTQVPRPSRRGFDAADG